LTFAAHWPCTGSAADLFAQDPYAARPSITVHAGGTAWEPRTDLVSSGSDDRHFVVEMEENGEAVLLFGNGDLGKAPPPGSEFRAEYRIGNGRAGNVGSGAIRLLIHRESNLTNDIARVWNPLPARGGTDREPTAEAKLNAPFAFRVGPQALMRAITADDYARIAERHPKIQRAAARLVWTGSWFEAEVGVDVIASQSAHLTGIAAEIETYLEAFRRIGHDLDVRNAEFVPLDLALRVCIAPEYLRGHVKAALLDAFSNRALRDGATGFFHPDRLTFGDDLYLSRVIATAQTLPGVVSVQVLRMQRQFEASNREIQNGLLPLGPFEIAQLDNDPNFPDHGRLEIQVSGGRG
jgi:predicted phage baseplate assembly protein